LPANYHDFGDSRAKAVCAGTVQATTAATNDSHLGAALKHGATLVLSFPIGLTLAVLFDQVSWTIQHCACHLALFLLALWCRSGSRLKCFEPAGSLLAPLQGEKR
jgi:hypothetical protein